MHEQNHTTRTNSEVLLLTNKIRELHTHTNTRTYIKKLLQLIGWMMQQSCLQQLRMSKTYAYPHHSENI